MRIKTFKRNELKFLLNENQKVQIERKIMEHMNLDSYCEKEGNYMIYNIYFDTGNDEVIRKSIDKPYYKEKLRIRSYKSNLKEDDEVYIELKKKIGGIVNKRRATIKYRDIDGFINHGIIPCSNEYLDTQVLNEIREFLNRYEVKPKVYLSYERVAYVGKDDSSLRITFDKNILTRREKVDLLQGDFGTELFENNMALMEVKITNAIPLWLVELLSELKVYSTGFSKYGTEYKKYSSDSSNTEEKVLPIKILSIAL